MSPFRKLWKLIKSCKKKKVTKEKKSSVKAVKKIHVKIQPLLAVAYHDAIIQWVEIFSEKTFLFFFAQVLSVQKFLYVPLWQKSFGQAGYTQYVPITNVGIFPLLGVLYFCPDFHCWRSLRFLGPFFIFSEIFTSGVL